MKILVFSVSSWNGKVGSNTWATLLEQYDSADIANICIRDEIPDSSVCSKYFCVSESRILKSIFNRKIKTGREISSVTQKQAEEELIEHNQRYSKYRKKRRYSILMLREVAWKLGKWKTKELNDFLDDFQPDIILHSMEGYIHLNRIIEYSIKRTGAKAIGYIWDDNFTYKQSKTIGYKIYRLFQRRSLKKLAKITDDFLAITQKTKREADAFFGIDCTVLSKPLNSIPSAEKYENLIYPIKFLYTGNLLIGRDKTLLKIVEVLKEITAINQKVRISVYTQTQLNEDALSRLNCDFCNIHSAIPQQEVLEKQKEADVLLFLEDMDGKDAKTARLSFSTKLTDYLSCGKCIFAVGNSDLAPMEYLRENGAAIVACNKEEIKSKLIPMLSNREVLSECVEKAVCCGIKNHNPDIIPKKFNEILTNVYELKDRRKG
ncbi:MAG: hypothetical protein IJX91_02835 [Clostridia bacterium]|nr:hypothetical protein [Clostridia bacterium]